MPTDQWYREVQRTLVDMQRHIDQLTARLVLYSPHQQARLAKTVAGPAAYPPVSSNPDAYWIVFLDAEADDAIGNQDRTLHVRQPAAEPLYRAHDPWDKRYIEEGEIVWVARHNKKFWILEAPRGLVGVELAVDHPGRGKPFDVWVGRWNRATSAWDYDFAAKLKAIDWRYDVPYPDACATGLAEWRQRTGTDVVLEIVALDCSSPGCHH